MDCIRALHIIYNFEIPCDTSEKDKRIRNERTKKIRSEFNDYTSVHKKE